MPITDLPIFNLYKPYAHLTDAELTSALRAIEQAELNYASANGQRTLSIGNVSFEYGSRQDLAYIKAQLISAYNARAIEHSNPKLKAYKITHLMR